MMATQEVMGLGGMPERHDDAVTAARGAWVPGAARSGHGAMEYPLG